MASMGLCRISRRGSSMHLLSTMMKRQNFTFSDACILYVLLMCSLGFASALPPVGHSDCISTHYTRPTTFEGGPYEVTQYYWCSTLKPDPNDITLVTQFTLDRAEKFQRLAATWEGPIAATLVLNYGETLDQVTDFWAHAYWPIFFYTDIHIVWGNEKGNYPVNLARNVAIELVKTKRVFLLDVDFFTHQEIRTLINNGTIDRELSMTDSKTLVVFPAFEYPDKKKYRRVYIPQSKDEMYQLVKSGDLEIFHQHTCPGCHRPSNYSAWFHPDTSSSYRIEYQKLYEPYVIANVDDLPPFDERFADYGRNKIQLFYEMSFRGFNFVVLPYPFFVIHENHDDSKWRTKFIDPETKAKERSSELWSNFQYRRKAFHELEVSAKEDSLKEEETSRKRAHLSMGSTLDAAGRALAEAQRSQSMLKEFQRAMLERSRTCIGSPTPPSPKSRSLFSTVAVGVLAATPAVIGMMSAYKGTLMKRRTVALVACLISIFFIALLQLYPGFFIPTGSAPATSAPVEAFAPDGSWMSLSRPTDLVRGYCEAKRGKHELSETYDRIVAAADSKYLSMKPRTVMLKTGTAPSGSKHDFFSRTFYVPGKDGEMHPDVFAPAFDKAALWDLESQCLHLGLAYYITGEQKYAKRAASAIFDWFLNPVSYMTPHFTFASLDVDTNAPIGRQYGLVESHPFKVIVETLSLISESGHWSSQNSEFLRIWLSKLALWYQTSEFGHAEEKSGNNHQTGFYVMLSWMFTIQGDIALARRLLDRAKYKLIMQISPDGSQPRELKRPDAWWYVGYNLEFLTEIAMIAERVGVEFWNFEYRGRSLKAALEWTLSHVLGCEPFKYGTHPLTATDLIITTFPAFRRASIHFADARFEVAISMLRDKFSIGSSDLLPSFNALLPPPIFSPDELQRARADCACDKILQNRERLAATEEAGPNEATQANVIKNVDIGLD